MRQIINNFTIIKLIEINFVVYVLRQKKNLIINFFFSLTPTIFLSQAATLCSLHFSPYFLLNAQLSLSLSCCSLITKWLNGHN